METTITINGNLLRAIPAVHYRAVFAREVNHLCVHHATRPDAIAVELGSHLVNEIAAWMKELGIGPFSEIMLPCMLGILIKNRLIHPDYRDAAFFLQEHFGKPLCEISPALQRHLLHFSDRNLVGLSSTDSVIEAIRCAVELDIPVYGVDLDEFSAGKDGQLLIGDPSDPLFDLCRYVSENENAAALMRDPYVDGRRELAMAARLKTILGIHQQVLFTGGLAHWKMIKSLLANPSIRPAEITIPERVPNFTRVVVHPRLAVLFMDAYPVLTTRYEENRRNPFTAGENAFTLPDPGLTFRDILRQTYVQYFTVCESNPSGQGQNKEAHRIPDFEYLLAAMRMVHQQSITPMPGLLEVAQSMMPVDFIRILASQLMEIGRSWASPNQFPDLPVISHVPPEQAERKEKIPDDLFRLIETKLNNNEKGSDYSKKSAPFSVKYYPGNHLAKHLLYQWHWDDEPKVQHVKTRLNDWVWPPCEALLFGTAYEAAKIAVSESSEPDSAVFEGSIYNGLDVKASIRSILRGERKIYIRKPSTTKKALSPDGKKPEPTVFIFEDNSDNKSYWSLLMGGSSLGNHVKNKDRYNEIVHKSGSNFISSISVTYDLDIPARLKHHVESISMLRGITAFGSPCINSRQGAQWVEDNDYQCCPILRYSGFELLLENYKQLHQMDITADEWQTALIRFALPYAKERVVVIAPERYRISARLYAEAKQKKISLAVIPLNYFPAAKIAEMRQRVMVNALDSDGCTFPREVEAALGQQANQYMEMLPLYMQQQLKKSISSLL
jgi:hypothetical protein